MTSPPRAFAPIDFLQLVSVAIIWGANNVAAKLAIEALPPLFVVGARFAIVLVLLGWSLRPAPGHLIPALALLLALVGPLHFGVQYVGLALAADLAPMVVAMQLWAPASVLFAMWLLREPASPLRLGGVAIAFAGTASMTFDPVVFAQWGALALVALASCFYGLGTVLVRRIGVGVGAWAMQAWIALVTAPTLLAASFAFEGDVLGAAARVGWEIWAYVAFGAVISTVIANALLFRLVQKYEVSRTTPYLLMTPVVSFALSALVLGDTISPRMLAGAGATMAGVALVALAERRLRRAP